MSSTQHLEKFRREDGFIGYVITLFYNKRTLSGILTTIVIVLGTVFALRIQREAMPNVQADRYIVTVNYPGVSPAQVEKDAINPIEDVIRNISGIKNFSSSSRQGTGSVTISIDEDVDNPDEVGDEIYRRMDLGNIPNLSADVESLAVEKLSSGNYPIYLLALTRSSDAIPDLVFNQTADALSSQLEALSGVNEIRMTGYREQQIEIEVNPAALRREHVDLNAVVAAIQQRNVRTTAGMLEDPDNYKAIVTISEYQNLKELSNTIIRAGFDGNRVLLGDVAKVARVFPKKTVYSRANGQEAILLEAYKTTAADIVEVSGAIKEFMTENSAKLLPDGIDWAEINNEAQNVDLVTSILVNNGMIGFVLILLILFLFLDFTTAFWTASALPLVIIMTLGYMGARGISVNYLTLTAMITMIGMLVDHGIVISEGIFARRIKGYSPIRACIEGLKAVFSPVLVTAVITIMSFLPLLLISGIMGDFTRFFPIMVTVMLTFSFLEASFLLVSHLLHTAKPHLGEHKIRHRGKPAEKTLEHWFAPVIRFYQYVLRFILRHRWWCAILFLGILALEFILGFPAMQEFKLFDGQDLPVLQVSYEAEEGVALEKVQEDVKQMEAAIVELTPDNQIQSFSTQVYRGTDGIVKGNTILYLLTDAADRALAFSLYNKLLSAHLLPYGRESRVNLLGREKENQRNPYVLNSAELEAIPVLFANVGVGLPAGASGVGYPISFRFYSDDVEELRAAGTEAVAILNSIRGTQNIHNSESIEAEQVRVVLDYAQMARYGVSLAEVNSTLRTAFHGTTASKSRSGSKTTDFIVRLEERYRKSLRTILRLNVHTATGEFVPLSRFARLETQRSAPSINHFNGHRTLQITGDLDMDAEGVNSLSVSQQFQQKAAALKKKYPGVTLDLSGGEAEQTEIFLRDVVPAFIAAVILIFLILMLLFDSFLQPWIVMGVVPFGLAGGILALYLHGMFISFMAVLGFMGLIGVVVNSSVIMVEFINHIVHCYPRAKPELLEPMVLKGAGRRLRGVLLTTLTTVLGLFPTIYGLGGDPTFVRAVVIVLGYGLLSTVIITLFYIPALYMIQLDLRYGFAQLRLRLIPGRRQESLPASTSQILVNREKLARLEELEEQELPPDPWV